MSEHFLSYSASITEEPDEIVTAVLFLAAPASTFVTGSIVEVHGGFISVCLGFRRHPPEAPARSFADLCLTNAAALLVLSAWSCCIMTSILHPVLPTSE